MIKCQANCFSLYKKKIYDKREKEITEIIFLKFQLCGCEKNILNVSVRIYTHTHLIGNSIILITFFLSKCQAERTQHCTSVHYKRCNCCQLRTSVPRYARDTRRNSSIDKLTPYTVRLA